MLFQISKDQSRAAKINKKYIGVDFKDMPKITEETKKQNSDLFFTGGVRINNNMYFTTDEGEAYIKKSLKRKLP